MNDPLVPTGDPHGEGPPVTAPTPEQVRDLLLAEALTHRPDADRILARVPGHAPGAGWACSSPRPQRSPPWS